jgi:hypothetical protein
MSVTCTECHVYGRDICFPAQKGQIQTDAKAFSRQLNEPFQRLSGLTKRLLALPGARDRSTEQTGG